MRAADQSTHKFPHSFVPEIWDSIDRKSEINLEWLKEFIGELRTEKIVVLRLSVSISTRIFNSLTRF